MKRKNQNSQAPFPGAATFPMCLWMGPVRAPLAPALLHGLLALQRTLRAKHTFSREWGTSCLACMVFCLLVCLFLNIPATVQLPRTWAYTSALGQCPHSTTVLVPCARVAVSGAAELTPHFPRLLQGFSVDRRALAQREKGEACGRPSCMRPVSFAFSIQPCCI